MASSTTRSRLEAAWRIIRVAAFSFAHGTWAAAFVHSSTSAKLGAAAAAVGASEAVYRRVFPQGSRRVSGWVARALVFVQKVATEAPAAVPAVKAAVADVATVEADAGVPAAVRVE